MGTPLQLRRDADATLDTYTGPDGELVISTTDNRPRVQNGSTAGGIKLAKLSDFAPGAWQTPTLNLSWIGLGGAWQDPQYRKDTSGLVTIRGAMQRATASVDGVIFTLASGYRPPKQEFFICYSAGGAFRVNVYPNGDVETSGANMFGSSFGGIQFYID
jgi:hypothetical protein